LKADYSALLRVAKLLEGIEFRLVGGLAVQLLGEGVHFEDELAALSRPTADVDIAVLRIAALPTQAKVPGVDVLEWEITESNLAVTQGNQSIQARLPDDSRLILVPGTTRHVRVAGPASLVLLKSAAAVASARGKHGTDLADIATLALRERAAPSGVAKRLADWKPEMTRPLLAAIRDVRTAFATPESDGSFEFSKVVRGGKPIFDYEEWSRMEASATEQASIAVRRLLEAFE
jgi:hypothetical protein